MSPLRTNRPVVWIVHDKGGYDFKTAEIHGELKTIFKGDFNPFDLHSALRHVVEQLAISTADDWIIGVGSGIAGMLVALEFVRLHDKLPLLVYHTHRREYVKRDLTGLNQAL